MNWEQRLLEGDDPAASLASRIEALFAQQRTAWPALAEGEASLDALETCVLESDEARVIVQANPGRRRSTHAKVDAHSIAQRACFLCPANMPPQERGIAVGDLVILPNPYPILPRHMTIPAREHAPQRLVGRIGDLLQLAAAMGPKLVAFYNGPQCGASAPDHFHFQACASEGLPVFDEWPGRAGHDRRWRTAFGRSMLLVADADAEIVEADLTAALDALARETYAEGEPMVNLLATFRNGRVMAALFPRAAHRPRCYFAEDETRLAISPAAVEMAGILVTAESDNLHRVDVAAARAIYEEVSIDAGKLERVLESMAS